jgi:hypothetical protein
MKRFAMILAATVGLCLFHGSARADWGTLRYSGYQCCLNPLGYKYKKCKTCEEKRLEKFWHDYYHAMSRYYASLDHLDWVTYYKNHGVPSGPGCGAGACGSCPIINYAPVSVNASMQQGLAAGCMGQMGPGCTSGMPAGPGAVSGMPAGPGVMGDGN